MPHTPETTTNSFPPAAVESLLASGFQETSPLFNVAINNSDQIRRYDLINPLSNERVLWTPPSHEDAMAVIEDMIGNQKHPVFFPKIATTEEGVLYSVPTSVRTLAGTLIESPYIEKYNRKLTQRGSEFLGKLAVLDENSFGLDLEDVVISHNGLADDDSYFSLMPPVNSPIDTRLITDPRYRAAKRKELQKYITELKG
jgi:hypothetical protein